MRKVWNLETLAAKLDITTRTALTLLKQGKLPGFKVGNQWRFRPEDVERMFQQGGAGGADENEHAGTPSAA